MNANLITTTILMFASVSFQSSAASVAVLENFCDTKVAATESQRCKSLLRESLEKSSQDEGLRLKRAEALSNADATQPGADKANVTLQAEKGASRVTLRLSVAPKSWENRVEQNVTAQGNEIKIAYGAERWSNTISVSTPASKSGDTTIASNSRLQSGTAIEWKSGIRRSVPNTVSLLVPQVKEEQEACRVLLIQLDKDRNSGEIGRKKDKRIAIKPFEKKPVSECDGALLEILYADWKDEPGHNESYGKYAKWLNASNAMIARSESTAAGVWGFDAAATFNFDDYSYIDTNNLQKLAKERQRGKGLTLTGLYANPVRGYQASVSAEFSNTYKAGKPGTICPLPAANATNPVTCLQGAVGAPKNERAHTLSLDLRQAFSTTLPIAIGATFSRDFKAKRNEVQIPVYMVPNDKGALIAGLKFTRNSEDKKGEVSIFVGAPFGLLD